MRGYNASLAPWAGVSRLASSVQTGRQGGWCCLRSHGRRQDVFRRSRRSQARARTGWRARPARRQQILQCLRNVPRIETEITWHNFQNIVSTHRSGRPRDRLRRWVDDTAAGERKGGDTAEQFYYKARKKAIGPFKRELWSLSQDVRQAIAGDLERTFAFLFEQLNVNGTEKDINRFVEAPMQHHAAIRPALVAAEDDPDAGE